MVDADMIAVFMDKITTQTLQEIDKLSADLKRCQRRLERIEKARVKVYFAVPPCMQRAFATLFNGLADMKRVLQGRPPRAEG